MEPTNLDRRDFHKFTLAALGGLVAGTAPGCGGGGAGTPKSAPPPAPAAAGAGTLSDEEKLLVDERHVCRGLNTCKGLGRSKDNECAGMGTCAAMADHSCGGQNECKGEGGCGENPGMNACKGKGGCHIPLMEDAWTKTRAAFEAAMKKSGKIVGAAPPAKT